MGSTPLLHHPDKLESDDMGGATIRLWVGDSVDKLLRPGGAWAGKTRTERLGLAATVGAGTMLARDKLDEVVSAWHHTRACAGQTTGLASHTVCLLAAAKKLGQQAAPGSSLPPRSACQQG